MLNRVEGGEADRLYNIQKNVYGESLAGFGLKDLRDLLFLSNLVGRIIRTHPFGRTLTNVNVVFNYIWTRNIFERVIRDVVSYTGGEFFDATMKGDSVIRWEIRRLWDKVAINIKKGELFNPDEFFLYDVVVKDTLVCSNRGRFK